MEENNNKKKNNGHLRRFGEVAHVCFPKLTHGPVAEFRRTPPTVSRLAEVWMTFQR
jgi:hypothetical protein